MRSTTTPTARASLARGPAAGAPCGARRRVGGRCSIVVFANVEIAQVVASKLDLPARQPAQAEGQMGIGYSVVVRSSDWPNMHALQECIDRHGWPVKLGDESHPGWTEPIDMVPQTLGIPVNFRAEPFELEAQVSTLEPDQIIAFNERLANIDPTYVRFDEGDRVLTLYFIANLKERQAGLYVMTALVECFGGYGLFGDHMHGIPINADSLLADAAEAADRESKPPPPITQDELRRFARELLEGFRKANPTKP